MLFNFLYFYTLFSGPRVGKSSDQGCFFDIFERIDIRSIIMSSSQWPNQLYERLSYLTWLTMQLTRVLVLENRYEIKIQ